MKTYLDRGRLTGRRDIVAQVRWVGLAVVTAVAGAVVRLVWQVGLTDRLSSRGRGGEHDLLRVGCALS